MPTLEDELASRLRGLTLIEGKINPFQYLFIRNLTLISVSRALREIADRLDESGRAAHRQPDPADTRAGYYADTDGEYVDPFIYCAPSQTPSARSATTRSTTSSHDQRHSSRSRHQERNRHPVHLEAGHHVNNSPPDAVRPHHRRDVAPHLDLSRFSATSRISRDRPDGPSRPVLNYSEPRIRHRSHISQSDSGRSARSDFGRSAQSDFGRSTRPNRSLSPSPRSLRQASTQQPLQPSSERHTANPTDSTRFISNCSPPPSETNDLVLGDVFDLDESLVRCRTLGCKRTINRPERGSRGSQGRWYFACCGRKVGIFNEW